MDLQKKHKGKKSDRGGRELDKMSEIRINYIKALRAADGGDLTLLLELYAT